MTLTNVSSFDIEFIFRNLIAINKHTMKLTHTRNWSWL